MSTAPLFKFFANLSSSEIDEFNLKSSIEYDVFLIGQYIHNPLTNISKMDDLSRHNLLVMLRERLDIIINAINNYERENKENTPCYLENN